MRASHLLVALPSAVGCARRFVRAQLRGWGLGHLADLAEWLVSVLTVHALTETGDPAPTRYGDLHRAELNTVVVRLLVHGGTVIVEVWDSDPAPPAVPGEPAYGDSGWPLEAIAALSRQWGYRTEAGGKVIWCEIPAWPEQPRPPGLSPQCRRPPRAVAAKAPQ